MMNDKVIDLATIGRLEFCFFLKWVFPIAPHFVPISIAQSPPLVIYIVSPKEKDYVYFPSAQRLITFFGDGPIKERPIPTL
jgi:hypothetical protein